MIDAFTAIAATTVHIHEEPIRRRAHVPYMQC